MDDCCVLTFWPGQKCHSKTIFNRYEPRQVWDNTHVSNNWYQQFPQQKNRPDSTNAENTSPLYKYRKIICAFFRQTRMCEILGQPHWCFENSISRIKILISNPQVPNIKTCPKGLNYRYAGFQILDWNSNFQSSLVRTTDKLQQTFTQKDLFTIKNSIHKIYCLLLLSIKKRTATVPVIFVSLLSFSPLLWYNITHSSNLNFYLGISHFLKKLFPILSF